MDNSAENNTEPDFVDAMSDGELIARFTDLMERASSLSESEWQPADRMYEDIVYFRAGRGARDPLYFWAANQGNKESHPLTVYEKYRGKRPPRSYLPRRPAK